MSQTDDRPRIPYIYEPLPSDKSIRLLRITSHVLGSATFEADFHFSDITVRSGHQYLALSYTWKFDNLKQTEARTRPDQPGVVIQGKVIPISENLFDFLDIAWAKFPEITNDLFWIDALCINQDDLGERNAQVAIMREIYQNAEQVIIWVGRQNNDSQVALSVLKAFANAADNYKPPASFHMTPDSQHLNAIGLEEVSKEGWSAISRFLERAWFHRVWTVQEVVVAPIAFMVCEDAIIEWEELRDFLIIIMSSGMSANLRPSQGQNPSLMQTTFGGSDVLAIHTVYNARREPDNSQDSISTFLQMLFQHTDEDSFVAAKLAWLQTFSRRRALKDPRDRVFAIQNLATKHHVPHDWGRLQPDYSDSVGAVFTKFACYIIDKLSNLSLLSFVEDKSGSSATDIPSWVPDLNSLGAPLAFRLLGGTYECSRGRAASESDRDREAPIIDGNTLRSRGCVVAQIVAVSSPYDHSVRESHISSLLNFAANTGKIGGAQDTRGEAFMKTLVAGIAELGAPNQNCSSNDNFRPLAEPFKQFIQLSLSHEIVLWQLNTNQKYEDWWAEQSGLEAFLEQEMCMPSRSEIDEYYPRFSDAHAKARESDAQYLFDDLVILQEFWKPQMAYSTIVSHVCPKRRLFRTGRNNIGLAPLMARPGDEVWMLCGSDVFFALRRGPDGSFTFLGEAYLHGFMYGELFKTGTHIPLQDVILK